MYECILDTLCIVWFTFAGKPFFVSNKRWQKSKLIGFRRKVELLTETEPNQNEEKNVENQGAVFI